MNFIYDDELNTKIQSLNQKQREVFDIVHDCAKRCVKNLSSISTCVIELLHIFITGSVGCGKSFLTRVLHQSLKKTFQCRNPKLNKPKVLLLAPTGVASVNIDCTRMHTCQSIPFGKFGSKLQSLSDKMKPNLRNKSYAS